MLVKIYFDLLFSILGLKLGYEHKSYSESYNGFYFTNGVNDGYVLAGIDCCNFTDSVARCVGIDISDEGGIGQKYKYAEDGITDPSNINKYDYESDNFRNGEGGDWLHNEGHIMMIVENDGNGYYVIEDGKIGEINYYTYEMLSGKIPFNDEKNGHAAYKIINTDALYRNTATPLKEDLMMIEEDGSLCDFYDASKMQEKTQVFANPYWIIKQDNINLTPEEQAKLIEQYNKHNRNRDSYYVELIDKHRSEIKSEVQNERAIEEQIPVLFEAIK